MSKYQDYREVSRNEALVRSKLEKGWNAFSKEEVEGILLSLETARLGRRRAQQRLNFAHFTPIAWHFEDSVGLHERRPAPEGAINLFEKPKAIDFPRGWRIKVPYRVPGYTINEDGMLVINRSRCNQRPLSPNDVMAQCMHTMDAIRGAFINQNKQEADETV